MNISDIRIKIVEATGKLKAVASITIDGCFVVHDIKILEGNRGLFVMMPSRKSADGIYKDVAHPINTETREMLKTVLVKAYSDKMAESAG
jgi:putative septation protein spoVG